MPTPTSTPSEVSDEAKIASILDSSYSGKLFIPDVTKENSVERNTNKGDSKISVYRLKTLGDLIKKTMHSHRQNQSQFFDPFDSKEARSVRFVVGSDYQILFGSNGPPKHDHGIFSHIEMGRYRNGTNLRNNSFKSIN